MKTNQKLFRIVAFIVFVILLLGVLGIFSSSLFFKILNFIWIFFMICAIIFIFLGIMVIFGLRKEAERILDFLLEGSLTIVDFVEFLRKIWRKFLSLLKDFLTYFIPFTAVLITIVIYFVLIYLFKYVGKTYDITYLAIGLTIVLITAVNFIPSQTEGDELVTWSKMVSNSFKSVLRDSMELMIFVFFLTMDSTNLFFIPESLNVPLHSAIGSYDLMKRGIVFKDHTDVTLTLVIATIGLEVFRYFLKLARQAIIFYEKSAMEPSINRSLLIKDSIRLSFSNSKREVLKFITFTTFLISVFLLFPRLKTLLMVVTSVNLLILDLIKPDRLVIKSSSDLISRILGKIFRLN